MILFLDDDSYRHKRFKKIVTDIVDSVFTAQECIDKLYNHASSYDSIWLDHDLGGEQFVDENNINTGSEVARWIATNKPDIQCRIYIHSLNIEAAHRMGMIIKQAGYSVTLYPFTQLGENK